MEKGLFRTVCSMVIIALLNISSLFAQPLSGTYTIGGATPDYATFTSAASDLVAKGVNGPVVFDVRNGTYNEQVSIGVVSGVSAVNTITFQSENGDSTLVVLTSNPTSGANYTLRFNGCDYVRIQKMTVRAIGSTYSTAVLYETGSTNNIISNCVLQGSSTTSTNTRMAVVNSAYSSNINNVITHNIIKNGSYGIYYYGASTTGVELSFNEIQNPYFRGIEVSYLPNVSVKANSITTSTSSSTYIGIAVLYCDQATRIERNNVNYTTGDYGIHIYYCNGTSGSKGLICNNFVSVEGSTGLGYGLVVENSAYQNFYSNNVNIARSAASSRAFYQKTNTGSSNIEVRNNLLIAAGGYCMYIDQIASLLKSNYNDLYTTGSYVGYWSGNRTDLSAWQSATAKDTNSVSMSPSYTSVSDLHVHQSLLDNAGTATAGVTDDFDGQARTATPDMGADEWTPPANDVGVFVIQSVCDQPDSVYVIVKNFGNDTLTSVDIGWKVNGVAQTTFNWTGSLLPGATSLPVNLGYYSFVLGVNYTVISWTSNPNGGADPFVDNDTCRVLNQPIGMSGTYTVGGATPDYATIAAAITALHTYGVCGPVVFDIRDGSYTNQLYINQITGASPTNTITFQSESGDSTAVITQYNASSSYSVYLNGSDYLIFKKMTIRNTYGNSRAVYLNSGSTYNRFENCVLQCVSGYTNPETSVIYSPDGSNNNNMFINNQFVGGSYGIYCTGSTSPGMLISDNNFTNQYYYGIYLSSLDAPQVLRNTFTTSSANTSWGPIYLTSCTNSFYIYKNRIDLNSYGYYPMRFYSCNGTSGQRGLVSDNFITMQGASITDGYAIYMNSCNYVDFYHNSINSVRTNTASRGFWQTNNGGNIRISNNIIYMKNGYCMYFEQGSAVNTSDYNDIFPLNNYAGYWNGTTCNTLTDWKSTSSKDANSVSFDPGFVSNTDLHVQNYQVDNLGTPLASVTDDIDGQVRSLSNPDMGADEWTTPSNDAGVLSIDVNLTFCPNSDSVYVTLFNYGATNLTSVDVDWIVNAVPQTTFNWTGNLAPATSIGPISIGYYDFLVGTSYTLTVSTSDPNGTPDPFTYNDQSQITGKYVSMNGTYTIGGSTPDYATFAAAVTALNQRGVCGPVIFDVRNGTYSEQVNLGNIYGVSAINNIIFRSESGDSTAVILQYNSSYNYTLQFSGAQYVTFREMTIKAQATYQNCIRINNNAQYITVENCILNNIYNTTTSADYSNIYVTSGSNNYITFNNNLIQNGSYGIYLGVGVDNNNWIVSNNIFTNQGYRGVYLYMAPAVKLISNTVSSTTTYSSYMCFYLNNCNNNIEIRGNKLDLMSYGYYCLYLESCNGNSSQRGLIANNFITPRGTTYAYGYGIYMNACSYQDIFYNSVYVSRTSTTSSYAFQQNGGGSNLRIKNNIFAVRYGYAIYINNSSALATCNYNDLYSEYNWVGYWNGSTYTTLNDWKTYTGKDTNSYSVYPYFVSVSDLHVQQPILSDVALPLGIVTDDIEGQTRSLTTPDIGADEWNVPNNDAGIFSIDPITYCHGTDSVFVVLKNYGAAPLTSVKIDWIVNGVSQTQYNWTGNLPPNGTTAPFSIGFYPFNFGTLYNISATTSLPNGVADPITFNDQSQITNQYLAMSGIYTIGGSGPDFATFAAAATALNTYGVCGPVIMNVRNGTYTEQMNLGVINGTSAVNTVTFQAQSGDSTQVLLTYSSSYTVQLNACNYVNFDKMTVRATSSNRVFIIQNNTSNINITNCILVSPNASSTSTSYSIIMCSTGGSQNTNNSFINNIFQYGSYGIYYNVSNSSGIVIKDNIFYRPYYRGIYVNGSPDVEIVNNYIDNSGGSIYSTDYKAIEVSNSNNCLVKWNEIYNTVSLTTYRGIYLAYCNSGKILENVYTNTYTSSATDFAAIYLSYCNNDIEIKRNKIKTYAGYYGIYLYYCYGNATYRGEIENNLIAIAGNTPTWGRGIVNDGSTYQNYHYNTINIPSRTSTSTRGFYQVNGANELSLKNNIFTCLYGYPIQFENNTYFNYMNYNNYYCPYNNYVGYYGGAYSTLAAWQAATGWDTNSSNLNPRFVSDTNLYLQEPLLDNTGKPIAGITTDYSGNPRSVTTPDIGAIEWTAPPLDAGVLAIDDVASFCITSDSVYVTIKNYGSVPLTSVNINWTVNGAPQTPFAWTGNLAQGQTEGPFSIGYYDFQIATLYSIVSWTTDPNGGGDTYAHNDTSKVLNKYLAMSGTYTIGGTSPDFATYTLAVASLMNSGVCGPVVFNVRNGTYYEQFTIGNITGVSPTYTITFQSELQDSTAVTLAYGGTPIYFNDGDYIIFKKMTVRNTSSGPVIRLYNNSSNISIRNCILEGYTGSSTSSNDAVIYMSSVSGVNNLVINNNKIKYGSYGIFFTPSSNLSGMEVQNNALSSQYYKGIYINNAPAIKLINNTASIGYSSGSCIELRSSDAAEISDNIIYCSGTSSTTLYVENCNNNLRITKNKVTGNNLCFNSSNNTGTAALRGLVSDNFFVSSSSGYYGIYASAAIYQDFYNNSINVIRSSSGSYAFYQVNNGSDIRLKNNIFAANQGYAVYITQTSAIAEMDYNDLYTNGYFIGYWNGDRINLAYWQSASAMDVHSINVNPNYYSSSDLHTCSPILNNAGTPLASVPDDIDDQLRDPVSPDIGADEFAGANMTPDTIIGNTTVCSGQPGITYSISAIPGATSYTWSVPTGWTITSGQGTTAITATSGALSGDVCAFATSSCGSGLPFCLAITTVPSPTPGAITGNDTVCPSQTGLNYSIDSVAGALSYTWTVPSGWVVTSGQGTTDVTVSSGVISGNICVSVVSSCGSSAPTCKSVIIGQPTSTPGTITGNASVCPGDTSIVYSITPVVGAVSYSWSVPTGWTIVSGQGTISIIADAGTSGGNVCVTAMSNCGLSSSPSCKAVTVNSSIATPGTINGSSSVCEDQTGISYSVSSVPGAVSYAWTIPAGWSIVSGQGTNSLVVDANNAGGDICVTATNSCGITSSQSCKTISIITSQQAPDSILGNTDVCSGQTNLTYSVVSVPGAVSYTWTVPTGWSITAGQGTTSIIVTAGTGSGDICVTATNACAISSSQVCQTINVVTSQAAPGAITGSASVCKYQTNISYSIASVPGAVSYTWSVPTAWTITAGQGTTSIMVNADTTGGNVCVTATNNCGFTSTQTCFAVSVITSQQAPVSISGLSSVCPNETNLTYSIAAVPNAINYTWTVPSGWTLVSGQGSTSITVNAGGTGGNICVTASNSCGHTSPQTCLPVSIMTTMTTPGAISGNTNVCQNQSGLVYTVALVPGAVNYIWSVPLGWSITSGQGTNTINVTAGTANGNVCVIAQSSCGISSAPSCLAVTVNSSIATPGTISGLSAVCASTPGISYKVPPVSGAIMYNWTVPSGWIITYGQGTDSIVVTSATSGGNLCVTATNACGVTSSPSCKSLSVLTSQQAPVSVLGNDYVCASDTGQVYYIASVPNAISYNWTVPAGWTITSGQGTDTITVITGVAGGNICATATNMCGITSAATCLAVSIQSSVPAPASITGNSSVCQNQVGISYTAASVPGAISYNWTVPTGWTITSGQGTPSITVDADTVGGNICVTAENSCGYISPSTCLAVGVITTQQAPAAVLGNTTVCQNETGIAYSVAAVSGATSYNWTVPSGWAITSGQGTTAITVTSGTSGGNICVTATNSCSLTSSQTCLAVGIISTQQAPTTITGSAGVCLNETGISYSISSVPGAVSYNWTVPTGWTITSGQGTTAITVNADSTGGNVCVAAINSCGISSSATCKAVSITVSQQPPASITGQSSVCANQTGIAYSVSSVPGAVSYTWTVPAGWTITSGQGTSAITATSGTNGGVVCVNATNSCGHTSTDTCLAVSIMTSMPAPGAISGSDSVCPNQLGETYSVAAVPGAVTYIWNIPTGWTITSGSGTNSITVTTGSVSGNICVIARSACGINSVPSCLYVSVDATVGTPGTINGLSSVCPSTPGQSYYITPVSGAVMYLWTVPSGWTITAGNNTDSIVVTTGTAGGNVCVTAVNGCGITSSASCKSISIATSQPAPANITGLNYVCSNDTGIVYTVASAPGAVSYNWTVPSGWSITSGQGTTSITVNSGVAGGNICVTATNGCGMTSSATCYAVNIMTGIQAPVAVLGNTSICKNETGISYSIAAVTGAVSYNWTVPSGWSITSGQGTTSIIVDADTVSGNVCVTAENSCGQISSQTCLAVGIISTQQAPTAISGLAGVCLNQTGISYSISSVPGAVSYNWTVPTGWTITSGQGTTAITVNADSTGGNVCAAAINSCGISSSATCKAVSITVSQQPPAGITGQSSVCQNQTGIAYSVSSVPGAVSYNWTVPTGWTITSGQGTSAITATSGINGGDVCVNVTNSCGITSSDTCYAVSIMSSMPAPGAITGNSDVCPNQIGETYSIASVPGAVTYIWNVPTGWTITSGLGTNTITVTTGSASGNICVIARSACGINSVPSCLYVNVDATIGTPGTINGLSSVCPGTPNNSYYISPVTGAVTYVWSVPSGWTITAGNNTDSIVVTTGTAGGNVCVTAVNSCGITSSASCKSVSIATSQPAPANITGNNYVCNNDTGLIYTAVVSPGAVSYNWTVPSGWSITSGQGTTSIKVNASSNSGNICVTATNGCGMTSSATCYAVTVMSGISAPAAVNGVTSVCINQTGITYSIVDVPGAVSYNWTVPAGWTIVSGQGSNSINVDADSLGGNICVTASNSCGSTSSATCLAVSTITTMQSPNSVSGSTNVCQSTSGLTYTASTVAGAVSYNWTVPSGWSINSGQGTNSISVTSGITGGDICVTATNSCGVISSAKCLTVYTISSMIAPSSVMGNNSVCQNQTGEIYAVNSVPGAVAYNWTVPSGWSITAGQGTNSISVTTGTSSGDVCVTAENSCGIQSAPACMTVSTITTMTAPASISGDATVCQNETGLTYSVASVPGAVSYSWTVPAGWSITAGQGTSSITVSSGVAGGNVCVTATNSCGITSTATCLAVSVSTSMTSPGAISGTSTMCPGVSLTYTIASVPNASSYAWTVPTGWSIVTGQGTTSISVTSGSTSGNICVTATNDCGITSAPSCKTVTVDDTITAPATISGQTSVCSNQSGVIYAVAPSYGAVSYNWSVPSGWIITNGQGTNTISVYTGTLGGSVCVTAINNCGTNSSPVCLPVSINTFMTAPGTISGDDSICPYSNGLVYNIAPVTGAVSYIWTVPAGWYITSGQGTTTITASSGAGTGNVCVTAVNTCGAVSAPSCLNVVLNTNITTPGTITGSTSVCPSQTGIIYSISAVNGASSYTWTVPSGWYITSGQGTTSITVNAGTTGGNICVSASNGCVSSSASCLSVVTSTVLGTPSSVTGLSSVCSGQTGLIYSVSSVNGATSYNWNVPSSWTITSGQGTNIITVTAGGSSGTICVSASNSCTTSLPACLTIVSGLSPSTPTVIHGPDSVCPSTTDLSYYVDPIAGATAYTWSFPIGWSIATGQGNSYVAVNAGTLGGVISVSAMNSCGSSGVTTMNAVINPLPLKPVITETSGVLTASFAYAYQWYFNGSLVTGATSQTFTPTVQGYYTVVVFNQYGCSSTSDPYSYSNFGIDEDAATASVGIYPNPAHSTFTIYGDFTNSEKVSLKLLNVLGETVLFIDEGIKGDVYNREVAIGQLPVGVYYVSITTDDKVSVLKLVKN